MAPHFTRVINVAIVERDHAALQMLSFCVDSEPDLRVVGVASDMLGAYDLIEGGNLDVVLLDGGLSGSGGHLALAGLLRARPGVKVVMLKGIGEHDQLARAIEGGCVGLLSKDRPSSEVAAAIRSAACGGLVMRTGRFCSMLRWLPGSSSQHLMWLTPREQQVLELLARELSEQEVADQLGIARDSVERYVRAVMVKFGARSKLEAVAFAVRGKLIAFEDA